MRLFFLTLLTATVLIASSAPEAAQKLGAENNYAKAVEKAQKENKMLVMVIVKEHCRWCDKLINKTLSDASVKEKLDKDYVTLIIDKDAAYPKQFKENFFPSIFFIDSKTQKSIFESVGYMGAKCFKNDLKSALETHRELYAKE